MAEPKPLALIAVETADESRCEILEELGKLRPAWTAARERRDKAEEELLEAQTAARERFPNSAYDQETSHALNLRGETYERCTAKWRALDSRKRSLDDKAKKMTAEVLRLVGEMREPGLWAAGEKHGPDGWKQLKLRVLVGGPDPEKELDKQDWTCRELEKAGYHTIGEFLKGRGRLIAEAIDNAELAADTVAQVDVAVYRFLERKDLLKLWPKDVPVPAGGQLTFELDGDDENDRLLDSVAPKPGAKLSNVREARGAKVLDEIVDQAAGDAEGELPAFGESCEAIPPPPPLLGPDLYDAATAGRKGQDYSKARAAAGERVAVMMGTWDEAFPRTLAEDEARPEPATVERFAKVYGSSPAAMIQRLWHAIWHGAEFPTSPVSEGTTDLFVQVVLALSDALTCKAQQAGHLTDSQTEEVMAGFERQLVQLDDARFDHALAQSEKFSDSLHGWMKSVHAFRKASKPAPAEPKQARQHAAGKKGGKKAGKKAAKR